jgi:hypothetical protein
MGKSKLQVRFIASDGVVETMLTLLFMLVVWMSACYVTVFVREIHRPSECHKLEMFYACFTAQVWHP